MSLIACLEHPAPANVNIVVLTSPSHAALAEGQRAQLMAMLHERPRIRGSVNVRVARDDSEAEDVAMAIAQTRPDVIVAGSVALARFAQVTAPEVPIVFEGGGDPVALCVVDSLARPGRNATGVTTRLDQEPKMLETLVDAYPALRRVVVLFGAQELAYVGCGNRGGPPVPCDPARPPEPRDAQRLLDFNALRDWSMRRGIELILACICTDADLVRVVKGSDATTGFVVPHHEYFLKNGPRLVSLMTDDGRPSIFPRLDYLSFGAILVLTPVIDKAPRQEVVSLVARLLDRADPAELPVYTPTHFELIVKLPPGHRAALRPSKEVLLWANRIER